MHRWLSAIAILAAAGSSWLAPAPVWAHDIWLEPSRGRLARGDVLQVRQLVGDALHSERELPFLPDLTRGFRLFTSDGPVELASAPRDAPRPLLRRRLTSDGLSLVTLEHDFFTAELDTSTFLEYLEEEGLGNTDLARRMAPGPRQRERYARSLKTLVQVGSGAPDDLHRRPLGQRLEILLLEDPYRLPAGAELPVRVLFEGEPLAGARVTSLRRTADGDARREHAYTDATGRARFALAGPGLWVIRLLRLRPCEPASACAGHAWESFWAAYSFHLDRLDPPSDSPASRKREAPRR